MIKLGVIADDFTGATDIASFMVNAGWKVVLLMACPQALSTRRIRMPS